MTTSPLPDLFPHLVPEGADIPDGVRTCRRHGCADNRDDAVIESTGYRGSPIWTEAPVPAPRPAPPSPGARLEDVSTTDGKRWDYAFWAPANAVDPLPWLCAETTNGGSQWYEAGQLVSWTVADVTPHTEAAPDPLDENDHRDRRDSTGDYWVWHESVKGEGHWAFCVGGFGWQTLIMIDETYGPIRFAHEVSA